MNVSNDMTTSDGMKVVIIGSGLGGLSCGVFLAKNGYDVTVLEKERVIGGCLQCFSRRGKRFETGMHFIGSAGEGQTLDMLMRYMEIADKVKLSPLNPDAYETVSIDGEHFHYAIGRKAFIDCLAERFPHQRENLERYFDIVEEVANASSLHSMTAVDPSTATSTSADSNAAVTTEYQLRSVDEVVESVIDDPLLQKVLVGNLPLYAGERGKTPFATHAFIVDFYNKSAFRLAGGSDTVAHALRDTIERYGGRVLPGCEVTQIKCDDERATSVVVNGTEEIAADYIISDIHPQRLVQLTDTKLLRSAYRRRVDNMPNTVSCFTVYLDFKEGEMPYMNSNFYGYNYGTPWDCEKYDEETWPKGYLYMHLCHEDGARFASTGEIICYMSMKDVEKWKGTRCGRRGQDYEDFKRRKAELLIDSLEKEFPGFRSTIRHYYTSTPLTYLDYTAAPEGCMYGVAKDINLGAAGRVHHRTKIPNLFLAGQNVNSHGMLGVLVGTLVACSELVPNTELYKQISEAR